MRNNIWVHSLLDGTHKYTHGYLWTCGFLTHGSGWSVGKIFTDLGMTFGAQNTHRYGSGSPADPLVPSPRHGQGLLLVGSALQHVRQPQRQLAKGARIHPYCVVWGENNTQNLRRSSVISITSFSHAVGWLCMYKINREFSSLYPVFLFFLVTYLPDQYLWGSVWQPYQLRPPWKLVWE